MSFERIGATELLHRHREHITGRTLDLGAGSDTYGDITGNSVTLDISAAGRPDVVGDAHALPFRSGAFDSVVASQVFEHLHSPWIAERELARVCTPGAAVLLAVPFLYWPHALPHDYYRYTEHGLRHLFSTSWRIDALVPYGGRLAVLCDIAMGQVATSTRLRLAVGRVRRMVVPPRGARRRPRAGAALVRARTAHHLPSGYFMVAIRASRDGQPTLTATRPE